MVYSLFSFYVRENYMHIYETNKKNTKEIRAMKNVKNKVYAIALLALSLMILAIDRDATALIITSFISVPMFFAKESWID